MTTQYAQFLAQLVNSDCSVFHFITYRRDKIKSLSFEQVLAKPTFLPSAVHCEKVLIEDDSDKYLAYKNNVHHWTTKYVWEKFLPKLFSQLGVNCDQSSFVKISYIWSTCDFSYHNLPNAKFKIQKFGSTEEIGEHETLRNTNNCPYMSISCYHSLFKLSHCSGKITNLNDAPLQRVVVNCDSMSIPVIPILACYCKELLVIDNRTGRNQNFMKKILDFKPTHYISLFTEENFLFNQKHICQIL